MTATGDNHSAYSPKRIMIVALQWIIVVAALSVLADHYFGAVDRRLAVEPTAVPAVAAVESFDGPDGDSLDSQILLPTTGTFGLRDKAAARVGAADATAIASLPGDAVGRVSVRITEATPGTGLVIRYRDPSAYWIVTPNDALTSWVVNKVQGSSVQTASELTRLVGNEPVQLSVDLDGTAMTFRADGRMLGVVDDAYLADVGTVGLVAAGPGAAAARFDNFVMFYPPTEQAAGS